MVQSSTFYTSSNVSIMCWEEKILGHNKQDISLKICWGLHLCKMTVFKLLFKKMQKQPVDVFFEDVLKNFAIFTEKHLC